MYKFLQCTPMNIVFETHPQLLFAMHLYSVWYLVMSVMFNSFPSKTRPLLTSPKKIFIGGVIVVTLHSFVICVPSMTVTFWTCSTEGRSTGNKFQDVTCCRYSFFNKNKTEKKQKLFTWKQLFLFFYHENTFKYFANKRFEKWKRRKLLDWGFSLRYGNQSLGF